MVYPFYRRIKRGSKSSPKKFGMQHFRKIPKKLPQNVRKLIMANRVNSSGWWVEWWSSPDLRLGWIKSASLRISDWTWPRKTGGWMTPYDTSGASFCISKPRPSNLRSRLIRIGFARSSLFIQVFRWCLFFFVNETHLRAHRAWNCVSFASDVQDEHEENSCFQPPLKLTVKKTTRKHHHFAQMIKLTSTRQPNSGDLLHPHLNDLFYRKVLHVILWFSQKRCTWHQPGNSENSIEQWSFNPGGLGSF